MAELGVEKVAVKEMRGQSNGRVTFLDPETTMDNNSNVGRMAVRCE